MTNPKFVKLAIFTPLAATKEIRNALASAGCGSLGNYDSCSFSVRGTGRYRPLPGSNPTIGEQGKINEVEEERIEVLCEYAKLKDVIVKLREVHPYDEPAFDVIPILNLSN